MTPDTSQSVPPPENDNVSKIIKTTLNDQIPETLAARMKGTLETLRQDLEQHPYVRELERQRNPQRPGFWSRVFAQHPVPWLSTAAAAVLVAVVVTVLIRGNRVSLADVVKAVSEQTWVHVKYDNGREQWINLRENRFFFKHENGNAVVLDYVKGVRYFCFSNSQSLTEDKISVSSQGATPWDCVVGFYEKEADNKNPDVEEHAETVAGRQLVRFDISFKDALGQRVLVRQTWADPETRLPIRDRERLQLALREEQKREFITGEYDFPATGPKDIYDLGVPRNLKAFVVPAAGASEGPDVDAVLRATREAQSHFPDHYRMILWSDKKPSPRMIEVAYRNGEKICEEYFSPAGPRGQGGLVLPATAAQVLEWVRNQTPLGVGLYDGEVDYAKRGPFPPGTVPAQETTVQVHKSSPNERHVFLFADFLPTDFQWPMLGWAAKYEVQPKTADGDLPSGCIWLTMTFSNGRQDFYVDPAHDYIAVRSASWENRSGKWVKERQYDLSGFVRLPAGQWYAQKRLLTTYDDPEKPLHGFTELTNVDVELLQENQYPPDIFNGKKLLEGAKAVTY
jgi:hypothetical protein